MAALSISSSLSSTASAVRGGFQQLRVQEARRDADRAEAAARALATQAQAAQRTADRADENARSLTVQSDQARVDAGRARQGVAYLDSLAAGRQELGQVLGQVIERENTATPAAQPASPAAAAQPPAVVNSQGQVTGTLVSTTA